MKKTLLAIAIPLALGLGGCGGGYTNEELSNCDIFPEKCEEAQEALEAEEAERIAAELAEKEAAEEAAAEKELQDAEEAALAAQLVELRKVANIATASYDNAAVNVGIATDRVDRASDNLSYLVTVKENQSQVGNEDAIAEAEATISSLAFSLTEAEAAESVASDTLTSVESDLAAAKTDLSNASTAVDTAQATYDSAVGDTDIANALTALDLAKADYDLKLTASIAYSAKHTDALTALSQAKSTVSSFEGALSIAQLELERLEGELAGVSDEEYEALYSASTTASTALIEAEQNVQAAFVVLSGYQGQVIEKESLVTIATTKVSNAESNLASVIAITSKYDETKEQDALDEVSAAKDALAEAETDLAAATLAYSDAVDGVTLATSELTAMQDYALLAQTAFNKAKTELNSVIVIDYSNIDDLMADAQAEYDDAVSAQAAAKLIADGFLIESTEAAESIANLLGESLLNATSYISSDESLYINKSLNVANSTVSIKSYSASDLSGEVDTSTSFAINEVTQGVVELSGNLYAVPLNQDNLLLVGTVTNPILFSATSSEQVISKASFNGEWSGVEVVEGFNGVVSLTSSTFQCLDNVCTLASGDYSVSYSQVEPKDRAMSLVSADSSAVVFMSDDTGALRIRNCLLSSSGYETTCKDYGFSR